MEIKGFIHRIDEIENHGFNFTSRFFYLRFQDRTGKTQYGKFKLSNGKIDLLEGFAINDEVNVIFEIEGNETQNNRNETVIFDRKEVYGITGLKEIKNIEMNKSDLYELQEGEEDEPLIF